MVSHQGRYHASFEVLDYTLQTVNELKDLAPHRPPNTLFICPRPVRYTSTQALRALEVCVLKV